MARRIVVSGCIALLAFDVIASVASRALAFPYARASVGTFFILLAIGFLAGQRADGDSARAGATATAIAGLVDATVGWAVSWAIGSGRSPAGDLTPARWLITAAMVVSFASLIGYVGGAVGGRSRRRPSAG